MCKNIACSNCVPKLCSALALAYLLLLGIATPLAMIRFWPLEVLPANADVVERQHIVLGCLSISRPVNSTELDVRLLLVVGLAGTMGSLLHALGSFADYVGESKLKTSWLLWYFLRPVVGALMGMIFYFLLRGGLLSGQIDPSNVNPYGFVALAALAGMFADQASLKLREVFDTLFKTNDTRGDTLSAPRVDAIDPKGVQSAQAVSVALQLYGANFRPGMVVLVEGKAHAADVKSSTQATITLDPSETASPAVLRLVAKNVDGGTSNTVELRLT